MSWRAFNADAVDYAGGVLLYSTAHSQNTEELPLTGDAFTTKPILHRPEQPGNDYRNKGVMLRCAVSRYEQLRARGIKS